jgi:septum formation protein
MKMAGFDFVVDSKNVEENHPDGIAPELVPQHLAEKKARAFSNELTEKQLVIGADTVVILDNKIFEKPANADEAKLMLQALRGKMHKVVTGVCLLALHKEISFSETTNVFFNNLTDEEISYYVEQFKPFDKAGSYACQEWIGAVGICKFEGDYFNVVGLPINRVYQELKLF